MIAKNTGKRYCYSSVVDRKKGMQMHEAYASGWRPTGKK